MARRIDDAHSCFQFDNGAARFFLLLSGSILTILFMSGCSKQQSPLVEAAPPPISQPSIHPPQAPKLASAQLSEVQRAVQRVFNDAVSIDSSYQPGFIVGDFNGDASPDLAVVIKAAPEKLSYLNQEFPGWILRDVSGGNEKSGPRLRVAANDEMLAVIHGFGPWGWRDKEATQTFLLKNAAGQRMATHPPAEFVAANKGKKLPSLRGDVISEELGGDSRYLYYARATYAWYDSRTFADRAPDPGMVHSAARRAIQK